MVVLSRGGAHLHEIKHAPVTRGGQGRHLRNGHNIFMLERQFGKISGSRIICTGQEGKSSGTEYVNAAEYLKNLHARQDSAIDQEIETCPNP